MNRKNQIENNKQLIDKLIETLEENFIVELVVNNGKDNVFTAVEKVNEQSVIIQNKLSQRFKEEKFPEDEIKTYQDYYQNSLLKMLDKFFGDEGIIKNNKQDELNQIIERICKKYKNIFNK